MENRYLFRAKRCDTGEWVVGNYQRRFDLLGNEEHYIFCSKSHNDWEYVEVDPSTICQCTGLKDKNGTLICENDILKYQWDGEERIDVIKYQPPIFTYSDSFRWSLNEDEVIGNIFENPELLEQEG